MRNQFCFLAAVAVVAFLAAGCANTERKFGRGLSNSMEVTRLGEFQRSMEQTVLTDGPDAAYSLGLVRGINRTLARTGMGIYEMITAPIPPYGPIWTDYLAPGTVYPDNFTPEVLEDSMFATDTNLRFSGGSVMPWVPGNRFHIFDSH